MKNSTITIIKDFSAFGYSFKEGMKLWYEDYKTIGVSHKEKCFFINVFRELEAKSGNRVTQPKTADDFMSEIDKIYNLVPFEKEFDCGKYRAFVRNNSLEFRLYDENGKLEYTMPVSSDFRNKWNEETGELIISNIYMTLTAIYPHEYPQMFDFFARGFQVNLNPKKIPV